MTKCQTGVLKASRSWGLIGAHFWRSVGKTFGRSGSPKWPSHSLCLWLIPYGVDLLTHLVSQEHTNANPSLHFRSLTLRALREHPVDSLASLAGLVHWPDQEQLMNSCVAVVSVPWGEASNAQKLLNPTLCCSGLAAKCYQSRMSLARYAPRGCLEAACRSRGDLVTARTAFCKGKDAGTYNWWMAPQKSWY